jgi:hypothetical protein
MSIRLLEHIQSELKAAGVVSSTPEFCNGWLGRSEGYIRTLRYHDLDPSVAVLSVCAHKLGYYADQLRSSGQTDHQTWVVTFDRLKERNRQTVPCHLEATRAHGCMRRR